MCSLEEKNNIITKDKLELDKIREKEMQQFNVDVFKEKIKNNEVKKELNTQEMSLVEIKKERWYTKFFNKLKKFLRLTK